MSPTLHIPQPEDQSRLDFSLDDASDAGCGTMAPGAYTLLMAFARSFMATTRSLGMEPPSLIGMDVRTRMQLGAIVFDFLAMNGSAICLKCGIRHDDPIWEFLYRSGIKDIWHLPSVPLTIAANDLAKARGEPV